MAEAAAATVEACPLEACPAAATVQAAAMVLVVVVAESLSPNQSQSVPTRECIKRRATPFPHLETLKFDLNSYPFMVLCNAVKYVQEEN